MWPWRGGDVTATSTEISTPFVRWRALTVDYEAPQEFAPTMAPTEIAMAAAAPPPYGVAQASSRKDEDIAAVLHSRDPHSIFGVFDGHGGKRAAEHCVEQLCPALMSHGPAVADSQIIDDFWQSDQKLGTSGIEDGSTATCLLVDGTAPGELSCALVWVGDSSAIVVDMLHAGAHSSAIVAESSDHKPDHPSEARRLQIEWDVREHIQMTRRTTASSPLETHDHHATNGNGATTATAAAATADGAVHDASIHNSNAAADPSADTIPPPTLVGAPAMITVPTSPSLALRVGAATLDTAGSGGSDLSSIPSPPLSSSSQLVHQPLSSAALRPSVQELEAAISKLNLHVEPRELGLLRRALGREAAMRRFERKVPCIITEQQLLL